MRALQWMILVAAFALAGCGNGVKVTQDMGGPDLGASFDMLPPPCVMNPQTAVEILNACTSAQTGDPTKDYPYFPAKAPAGKLPPLP